jgi:hypothetical protein
MNARQALRLAKAVVGSRIVGADGAFADEVPGWTEADADRYNAAEKELGWRLLAEAGLDQAPTSIASCARALGITGREAPAPRSPYRST